MALLEVACFSPESAIIADGADADRIELCDNEHVGGTTPAVEWLTLVKAKVAIPVFVMIRPRGGDFSYSDADFEQMKTQMDILKPSADGFVFGVLDHERRVDISRTRELVQRAHPLQCTFHRALDETPDLLEALEHVIAAGCHAILSSGGAPKADGGVDTLRKLVARANGRIMVMPGGGVRSQNLMRIASKTNASMYHSSALARGTKLPDPVEIRRMKRMLSASCGSAP